MMNPLTPLDEAALRVEARRLYKDLGSMGMYQVIYELMLAINVFLDVIKEERENE